MAGARPVLSIDVAEGTVSGPRGTVRLEPKVMSVLSVLARYSGHVVSRKILMDAVWGDAVVTEHTLSRCIYQLREQLGRTIGDGQVVETLPKRGYRLLVQIEQSPTDFRIHGQSLLIEIKRRGLLLWGSIAFLVALALLAATRLT